MPQILAPTGAARPTGSGPLYAVTHLFLDRQAVQDAITRAGQDPQRMNRALALIRNQARRSMRYVQRKTTHSAPGTPPRARLPRRPNLRSIQYFWDPSIEMGLVGSAVFPGTRARLQFVPEVHEFGGMIALPQPVTQLKIRRGPKRNRRPTRKQKRALQKKLQQQAFFQKMHPDWDKRVYKTFHYPPRPYMWPATMHVIHRLPQIWRGSMQFRSIQSFRSAPRVPLSTHGGFQILNRAI